MELRVLHPLNPPPPLEEGEASPAYPGRAGVEDTKHV